VEGEEKGYLAVRASTSRLCNSVWVRRDKKGKLKCPVVRIEGIRRDLRNALRQVDGRGGDIWPRREGGAAIPCRVAPVAGLLCGMTCAIMRLVNPPARGGGDEGNSQ